MRRDFASDRRRAVKRLMDCLPILSVLLVMRLFPSLCALTGDAGRSIDTAFPRVPVIDSGFNDSHAIDRPHRWLALIRAAPG